MTSIQSVKIIYCPHKNRMYVYFLCKPLERVEIGIHFNIQNNKNVYSNSTLNMTWGCSLDYVLEWIYSAKFTMSNRESLKSLNIVIEDLWYLEENSFQGFITFFTQFISHNSISSVSILSLIFFSQHFNVGSTLFQRCESTLKKRWSDVENETKCDITFSTLHNVDATLVSYVETTLNQRCTTSLQRCFSIDMTLSQRWFNVVSTSLKGMRKPIWPLKSMDLQKDW